MSVRNNGSLKRFVFTLNNYGPEDEERIQGHIADFRFAIYGREIAPSTGTPHLQGM